MYKVRRVNVKIISEVQLFGLRATFHASIYYIYTRTHVCKKAVAGEIYL